MSLFGEVFVVARFAEAEVVEVWDRWQAGEANRLIGRDLGRSAASIRDSVESMGGEGNDHHLGLVEGLAVVGVER